MSRKLYRKNISEFYVSVKYLSARGVKRIFNSKWANLFCRIYESFWVDLTLICTNCTLNFKITHHEIKKEETKYVNEKMKNK